VYSRLASAARCSCLQETDWPTWVFAAPWQAAARPPAAAFLPVCWVAREAPGKRNKPRRQPRHQHYRNPQFHVHKPPPHAQKSLARGPHLPDQWYDAFQRKGKHPTTHGTYHPLVRYSRRRLLHHHADRQGQARREYTGPRLTKDEADLLYESKADHLPVWTRQRVNRDRRPLQWPCSSTIAAIQLRIRRRRWPRLDQGHQEHPRGAEITYDYWPLRRRDEAQLWQLRRRRIGRGTMYSEDEIRRRKRAAARAASSARKPGRRSPGTLPPALCGHEHEVMDERQLPSLTPTRWKLCAGLPCSKSAKKS